jgi:hypothetical protein
VFITYTNRQPTTTLNHKNCIKFALYLCILFGVGATISQAKADVLLDEYVAELSWKDHFNSNGVRLDSAAAIIRQDRANVHRYVRTDLGDTSDFYFKNANNRALLERLIARGTIDAGAERYILNGEPMTIVRIYRSDEGFDYVRVGVVD